MEYQSEQKIQKSSEVENADHSTLNQEIISGLLKIYTSALDNKDFLQAETYLNEILNVSIHLSFRISLIYVKMSTYKYNQAIVLIENELEDLDLNCNIRHVLQILKMECLINLEEYQIVIDEAVKIDDFTFDEYIYSFVGLAQIKLDQLNLAEESFQQALNHSQSNEYVWLGVGIVHFIKGDLELGRGCFAKALDSSPSYERLQNFLSHYVA